MLEAEKETVHRGVDIRADTAMQMLSRMGDAMASAAGPPLRDRCLLFARMAVVDSPGGFPHRRAQATPLLARALHRRTYEPSASVAFFLFACLEDFGVEVGF